MLTSPTARLSILIAALLFSTGGAAVKATTLSGWQVASLRSGVAAVTLLLLIPSARQLARPRVWLVGVAYATTLVLYVLANKLTTAADAIFLQSTAPLYVLLLSPLVLHERIRRRDLLFMGLLALGMALFLFGGEPATEIAANPPLGKLLGAGAGVSYALTLIGLRWLQRSTAGLPGQGSAAAAAGNVLACVAILPLALPMIEATPLDWGLVLFLGVFQIGLAYVLLTSGMRQVSAFETSLLLLLEPVLNPLFTWIVHDERTTSTALIGGLLILGSTLTKAWWERRWPSPAS